MTSQTHPQRPPNNRLHGRDILPALAWNDGELLAQAAKANGKAPPLRTKAHSAEVIALFQRHNLCPPTAWAALQWVRRNEIPDRWRATLVYMLMRDNLVPINRLFRRNLAPPATATPR